MKTKTNKEQAVYEAIAKSLRQFGYPSATSEQVADTHRAMVDGNKTPHGIIGMFAEKQLKEAEGMGLISTEAL